MVEYVDVVIVGAGLSGIGAACHLQTNCPNKSYLILEGRERLGGTWDLFRYPGIRSDSDMHTLGYSFKPWTEAKAIADGPSILNYLRETAVSYNVDQHIRYSHHVTAAAWDSSSNRWTLTATQKETGETVQISCNFLFMCAGYYSYKSGYTPAFAGRETFQGEIIHPQKWPDDLDYRDKRVVVIGSGATAVTLIPKLAEKASHVTMLQRSPTYIASGPSEDKFANFLRKILPNPLAYKLVRWKNVQYQQLVYKKSRTDPDKVKEQLLDLVREELGPDYDVETHFTPRYNPWDQRLCLVPDSDFFTAINSGKASVVTEHIDTFTEHGICLQSGQELEADIIITATGLNMVLLGEMNFAVDGAPVDFAETYTYRGMMTTGVPNLISTFGYVNASWTLRSDIIAEFSCRLLNYMDEKGFAQCVPQLRESDKMMEARPYVDDFSSNYMARTMHLLPKQGDHEPWLYLQNYTQERRMFRRASFEDGTLLFE
ncbi:MAG: NAD(P)/FAD-dependent oxidoreductase [Chloroflexota bacterium]